MTTDNEHRLRRSLEHIRSTANDPNKPPTARLAGICGIVAAALEPREEPPRGSRARFEVDRARTQAARKT